MLPVPVCHLRKNLFVITYLGGFAAVCDRGREGIVGVEGHERVLLDIANKLNRGGLVG